MSGQAINLKGLAIIKTSSNALVNLIPLYVVPFFSALSVLALVRARNFYVKRVVPESPSPAVLRNFAAPVRKRAGQRKTVASRSSLMISRAGVGPT